MTIRFVRLTRPASVRCVTPIRCATRHSDVTVPERPLSDPPLILLGAGSGASVTASIYAIVDRGAKLRPQLAHELRGSVLFEFAEGYVPARIDFRGDEIEVADGNDHDRAHDLLVQGSLPDIVALIAAPLAGGLPKPTTAPGRAALARLADGRVEFEGPLRLARGLMRLLSVAPELRVRRGTSVSYPHRPRRDSSVGRAHD